MKLHISMTPYPDLGSFTLPCYINNVCFNNALVDLGASVSVMPLLTYLNLELGELAHTRLTVELADRTVKYLKGIAENKLVGIGKFTFPVDFIIQNDFMPEDIQSYLVGVVLLVKDCRMINLIMEYLVNISKRRTFWSLNEDILKITILKKNTPYPSRKIRRICACTHQRPQRKEDQYACMTRSSTSELFTPYKEPEQEFRSIRRHFKTLSLDELRSPDFNLLSDQENSEQEEAETMAETMEQGAIPLKTTADAKVAIQEMADYSQKWHNGISRSRSTKTSDGLASIQAQLNNLGREIKKVNEKVYAAQVGCEQCKGPYYTKDSPLKEEGKTLEEAYYTELKDEALRNKAIMEGLISDDESSNDCWKRWKSHEIYYHNYDEGEYENETHEEGHDLRGIKTRKVSVCQIKRYKMIIYSFNDEEEYVAVKKTNTAILQSQVKRRTSLLENISDDGRRMEVTCRVRKLKKRPRERNIDEYWWRIYKSGDLEVLES
ncbi:retrovirus-related pol polyprotein from transposon TNT 1-94 [Tanacetum coccineum]